MASSTTNLYPEEKREETPTRHADMSFILPLFPGDVRDSDGRQLGGPEALVHPSCSTLPRSAAAFQFDDGSNAVGLACEALRCVLE